MRRVSTTVQARSGNAGALVAAKVREAILGGYMVPGTRVRQEELAERYQVSRAPVREALRILESEGLIRFIANTGAWIAKLTLEECQESYQMRERLEPLLLGYSIDCLAPTQIKSIARSAQALRLNTETEDFLRLDREFHMATYSGARTSQLKPLVEKLWNTTSPYRRAYVATWTERQRRIANDEHLLLVNALEDGDLVEAKRVLESHIRRTRIRLEAQPELFLFGSPKG